MPQESTPQEKMNKSIPTAGLTHSRRTFLGGTAGLGLNSLLGNMSVNSHQENNENINEYLHGRYIVCLGYDFDTITLWLPEAQNNATELSRGIFGAEVGVPRLLDLHQQLDLPATFFIPGQTIESFPEISEEIYNKGYDIQHHGWNHTSPTDFESKQEEKAAIERGISSIESLTGRKPTGYRAPSWAPSANTLEILQELGFEWDSSQMARDFEPYYLRGNWSAPPDEAYEPGEKTNMLEFPVSWERDDWPPLQSESVVNEQEVFDHWKEQFDSMVNELDGGIFDLTMHPQVIGRPPRIRYLKSLLQYMQSTPNVEFGVFDEIAKEIKI